MKDWKERVMMEKEALDIKIDKLTDFLLFDCAFSMKHTKTLDRQLDAMKEYSSILSERLNLK